mgnify:CR=1 FL=1
MSAVRSSGLALPADAARFFEHQLQFRTDPADLAADLLAKEPGIVVIDTRSTEHYRAGHIPGAVHASRGLLEFKLSGSPQLASRWRIACR